MIKNPWGLTLFDEDWNFNDKRWTDELVAKVPFGIDPRTSHLQGIFLMPADIAPRSK